MTVHKTFELRKEKENAKKNTVQMLNYVQIFILNANY